MLTQQAVNQQLDNSGYGQLGSSLSQAIADGHLDPQEIEMLTQQAVNQQLDNSGCGPSGAMAGSAMGGAMGVSECS